MARWDRRIWWWLRKRPEDQWIAMAAVFIAVCALLLSVYEGRAARAHERLSALPVLMMPFFYNDDGAGFVLHNSGLGSARLKWFEATVDKKPQPDWRALCDALGVSSDVRFDFLIPGREVLMREGPGSKILWVPPGPNASAPLILGRERVFLRLCFCSLYDECWMATDHGAPTPIPSCEPAPEVRFAPPPIKVLVSPVPPVEPP